MKQKLLLLMLFLSALTFAQRQPGGLNVVSGTNHLFTTLKPANLQAATAARPAATDVAAQPMACLTGGQYPAEITTPPLTGVPVLITDYTWPGEFAMVNVSPGNTYTFNTNVATDYITIAANTGSTVYAQGMGTVTWTNTSITGNIRYYIHLDAACGTSSDSRNRYVSAVPTNTACNAPTGVTVSNVGPHSANISWNAVAGAQVQGYQIVYTTGTNVVPTDDFEVTITDLTNTTVSAIYNSSTTYYHFIRTICSNGNSAWVPFQFTTTAATGCTTNTYPQWPATFTPACTGVSENIATDCYAGEYSVVVASAARRYTFNSSVATDMITVTNATGTTVYAAGLSPLVWNSGTISGNIRFYTHTNANCGAEAVNRTRSITCQTVSCGSPSGFAFTNITPTSATITWNGGSPSPTYYQYAFINSPTQVQYDNLSIETGLITTLGTIVTDLTPSTTYYIAVRSICGDIPGPWIYGGNFTTNPLLICNTAQNGLFPAGIFTPGCTGSNETITEIAFAGEYSNVNVTAGRQYTFSSSDTGDFLTITNAAGTAVLASGTTPLVWTAPSTATIRYFLHASNNCDAENVFRIRYIRCGGCTTAAPVASALSFCGSATVANLTATGTNLKWYIDNTSTTVLNSTTVIFTRTYYVSQTVNGCESPRVAVPVTVTNTVAAPTAPDFNLCSGATVANLTATGTNIKWYSSLTGGSPLASTVVLTGGTYFVSQTVNGCESSRNAISVNISSTAAPAASAQTFCGTTTVASLSATGTNIRWYLASTGGTQLSTSTQISTRTYYVSQTVNGCESSRTAVNVTVNTVAAPTAFDVTLCSGATVANLTATGSNIKWYNVDFGGSPLAANTPLVTGYYFPTQTVNGCESNRAIIMVTIATPAAPIVAYTGTSCVGNTGTITVMSPLGQGITYSINGGNSYQSSPAFANLASGSYTVYYKDATGCRSAAFIADVYTAAAPDAPTVTTVQPSCSTAATGAITITNAMQGLTYSIDGINYQSSNIFTSVNPGTYTVSSKNGAGCVSATTLVPIIPMTASLSAPTATFTAPSCTSNSGSITITSPLGAGYAYSVNGGTTFQSSPSFANLAAGSYLVVYKTVAGCTSNALVVNILAPATPAAPTVTTVQPTCAVATGTITVSAPTGTGITYSINGTTYVATPAFTGLAAGTYSVTARNAAGCTSAATSVTINAAPATPAAPTVTTVQPTCAVATGSITVSAPTGTGITYSINGTTYVSTAAFTGLAAGTYSVTAKNAAGCTSAATSVTINAAPATPAAPTVTTVQPTCAVATGSITVSTPTGTGITYSINGTTYVSTAAFTGLAAGTYSVTAKNAAGCTSAATSVTINAAPATPAAPTITTVQPTCAVATGTITVSAPTGTGITYSINGTTYVSTAAFTGLAAGTYSVTARNAAGCTSAATSVTINAAPATPAAPTVTTVQPTCAVATGTITVSAPTGTGITYSINGTTYVSTAAFTGLAAGTYSVTARNAAGCTSVATSVTINAAPATPAAPTVTTVQPTCAVATGTITVSTPTGTGITYSINGTTYVSTAAFTGLAAGTYSVTARNAAGCTSAATSVTINAAPATPAAPVVTTVQPTCAVRTGTITVTAPTGTGLTYSINGNSYVTSATFANLDSGTYSVSVRNAAGCTSTVLAVTINAAPAIPNMPTTTVTQPTCTVGTGTVSVNNPATGQEYSLNGGNYQTSPTFTNVAPGTYTIAARSAAGCVTSNTVTVGNPPAAPAAPTVTIVQPTCAESTGTITITAPTELGMTYSINGQSYTQSRTFTSLAPGTYSVTARTDGGCTSATATTVTINAAPAPEVPMLSVTQTTCSTLGSVTVTAPLGAGYTYTIDGGSQQASPEFTFLLPGTYVVTVINPQGCTTVAVATINAATLPDAPLADVQNFCGSATVANLTANGDNLQWYASADATTPLAASTAVETGVYFVSQTVNGCESARTWVDVVVNTTSLPTAETTQVIIGETAADATIEDLIAEGSNLQWYASPEAVAAGTPLVQGTELVNGATYYVTQTVNGCESAYVAVTVEVVLNTDVKQGIKFTYYPNPVKDRLHIISGTTISLVEVYNLQGQKVISQPWNAATGDLNMVQLEEANYLVRVYAENNTQSFMVSKGH